MTANETISGNPVRSATFYQWNTYIDQASFDADWKAAMIAQGFPSTIGMLTDTSRNGWGGSGRPTAASTSTDLNTFVNATRLDRRIGVGNWCNQPGGIGARPQANPGNGNALIVAEEAFVIPILPQFSFKHVLDVGTGTGRYALKLARQGMNVTALGQSPEMLAIARQRARQEGLYIDFQRASLDNGLPFATNQFDLLICALTLCHIPDIASTVQEFVRVLQPGGYLLITDFHPDSVQAGWRTQFTQDEIKYLLPNVPYTRDDYLQALTKHGLSILNVIDISLGEVPEGYLSGELLYGHEDQLFCLIILAQK